MGNSEVRLDKWLDVSCIFKTRTQASKACQLNRVRINGQKAKPHRLVRLGDRVEVEFPDGWTRVLVVEGLRDRSVSKAEARSLYEDVSSPRPRLDPVQRIMLQEPNRREKGAGRPTKRDRRRIESLEASDLES